MSPLREDWYSTTDVAKILGRSDRYVRDRVKRGEIPAQEGGGGKRVSYKISREALLGYLMANEQKNTAEVGDLIKGADVHYLREMEQLISHELHRRAGGKVTIVPKCRRALKAVMALEKRNYPNDLFPTPAHWDAAYERCYNNPYHFAASAFSEVSSYAEGYLSIGVTNVEFFEGISTGKIKDDSQPAWEEGKTPILYINSFIAEDPVWAHFLFKELARQLKDFFRWSGITVNVAFAIAANADAQRMLVRYGFAEVGKPFEGRFPVMLNRDLMSSRVGVYLR